MQLILSERYHAIGTDRDLMLHFAKPREAPRKVDMKPAVIFILNPLCNFRAGGTNIDPTEWIGSVYFTLSRCRAFADLVAVRVEAAADTVVVSS